MSYTIADIQTIVAPYMGAWIEMPVIGSTTALSLVAPYMGAWIEIFGGGNNAGTRRCVAPYMGAWIEMGNVNGDVWQVSSVAPYMGAWIEILIVFGAIASGVGRSLHGSVD